MVSMTSKAAAFPGQTQCCSQDGIKLPAFQRGWVIMVVQANHILVHGNTRMTEMRGYRHRSFTTALASELCVMAWPITGVSYFLLVPPPCPWPANGWPL